MTTLLTIALAVLQVMDWYSTRAILNDGGKELNPVARAGIEFLGLDEFLVVKGVVVTVIGYEIGAVHVPTLAALVVWYAGVAVFNWRSVSK